MSANLRTRMFTAIHYGDQEGLREALADGANPNWVMDSGTTAVAWCVERAQASLHECLALLLSHGADPNGLDQRGTSPLMKACWAGNPGAARQLIEAGADVNHQGEDGFSVLMSAAGERRAAVEILDVLLQHGAQPNTRSNTGSTAWLVFARKGNRQALERLLQGGADPTAEDAMGNHAWDLVVSGCPDPALEGWLRSQAEGWTLREASSASHPPRSHSRL